MTRRKRLHQVDLDRLHGAAREWSNYWVGVTWEGHCAVSKVDRGLGVDIVVSHVFNEGQDGLYRERFAALLRKSLWSLR